MGWFTRWWRRLVYANTRRVDVKKTVFNGKINKISIVIGHKEIAPGAKSVSGLHEYFYWREVEKLIHVPGKDIRFFYRDGKSITSAIIAATQHKPDLLIETHFNAFNGKAHGCKCLYAPPSAKMAKEWSTFTAKTLKRRNRGAKSIRQAKRGVTNVEVAQTVAPQAFLIEPFFGDNSADYVTPLEMAECLNLYLVNL